VARADERDRVSRRVVAALLGLALAVLTAAGPAAPPAAAAPTCDTYGLGKKWPVLLVHGFLSSPRTWSESLYPRGGELPGAKGTFITAPFDYSGDEAAEWIQGNDRSTAARRLAERIQCLSQASRKNGGPGTVALIGHSLGGLLIRCALTTSCSRGPDVVAAAGHVVTIGTPSLGSFLRPNGMADAVATAFGRLIEAECAAERMLSRMPGQVGAIMKAKVWVSAPLCDYLTKLGSSSAGRAFTVGSPELAALPKWPGGVPVRTISASVDFTYQVLLWEAVTLNIGDLVVGVDSAASGAGKDPLGGTKTLGCGAIRLTDVVIGVRHGVTSIPDCNHISETGDRRIAGMAGEAVGAWIAAMNRPVTAAALRSAPVPALCVFPAGRLVGGVLPGQPASAGIPPTLVNNSGGAPLAAFGDLDGRGAADAAAAVNCNAGGVSWPDHVVFWAAGRDGPTVLGAYQMGDAVGDARNGTTRITWTKGATVVVDTLAARPGDGGCCASGRARVTLKWDGKNVVATDVEQLAGPNDVSFSGVGQVRLGMSGDELEALGYARGEGHYYGCVGYDAGPNLPSVTLHGSKDAVVKIFPAELGGRTPEGVRTGSTLDDVRAAYAGETIESYMDSDFGQGFNGLLVGDGSGGWISFFTDDGVTVSGLAVSDHDHMGAREAGCE
jgi:pimeloyl-ACP methyl ester carboxylesterase